MYNVATITGKRQLTIPADLYRKAGFSEGQKVIISLRANVLRIESAVDLVNKLAGSLPVPPNFQGLSPDEMIAKAKRTYSEARSKRRES